MDFFLVKNSAQSFWQIVAEIYPDSPYSANKIVQLNHGVDFFADIPAGTILSYQSGSEEGEEKSAEDIRIDWSF